MREPHRAGLIERSGRAQCAIQRAGHEVDEIDAVVEEPSQLKLVPCAARTSDSRTGDGAAQMP